MKKKKTSVKEEPITLTMTYEEAMKKALNTPLPKKGEQKKKAK